MQSQKEYPADMANCKDKFLVQSCCVSADKAAGDVSGLFSAEGGPSVTEAKLRVSFDLAEINIFVLGPSREKFRVGAETSTVNAFDGRGAVRPDV